MRLHTFPNSIGGQWITCITVVSLIIAPFGCQTGQLFLGPQPAGKDPFGLLINTDTGDNVLGGVRLEDGRSAWLYGTFNADGSVREVTGAGLRDADGQEAGITFEDGRPKHARSFDGSTIDFVYDEVSTERLKGHVDLYFADADVTETVEFDIDLQAAAADVAQAAADLAGLTVSDEEPAADAGTLKSIAAATSDGAGKGSRAELAFILLPVFAIMCVAIGVTTVWVMVQIMQAVMIAVVGALVAVTKAMVIAMFAPFIIMGELLRHALGEPVVTLHFGGLHPDIVFDEPLFW